MKTLQGLGDRSIFLFEIDLYYFFNEITSQPYNIS